MPHGEGQVMPTPSQIAQQHAFVTGQAQSAALAVYDLGASFNAVMGALTFHAQLPVDATGPAGKIRDAAAAALDAIRREMTGGVVLAPGLTLVKP